MIDRCIWIRWRANICIDCIWIRWRANMYIYTYIYVKWYLITIDYWWLLIVYIGIRCTAAVPLSRNADSAEKGVSAGIGHNHLCVAPMWADLKTGFSEILWQQFVKEHLTFPRVFFLSGKTFPCFNQKFISWQQRPPPPQRAHGICGLASCHGDEVVKI